MTLPNPSHGSQSLTVGFRLRRPKGLQVAGSRSDRTTMEPLRRPDFKPTVRLCEPWEGNRSAPFPLLYLILSGYLLFAHGCHRGGEDHELTLMPRFREFRSSEASQPTTTSVSDCCPFGPGTPTLVGNEERVPEAHAEGLTDDQSHGEFFPDGEVLSNLCGIEPTRSFSDTFSPSSASFWQPAHVFSWIPFWETGFHSPPCFSR